MWQLCITTAVLSAAGATSGAGAIAVGWLANGALCGVGFAVVGEIKF